MSSVAGYVGLVRRTLDTVTRRWEARGVGSGFPKLWDTHIQVAQEVGLTVKSTAANPGYFAALVKRYFGELSRKVLTILKDNAEENRIIELAVVRKSVASSTLRQQASAKDVVNVHACRAAALILYEAQDLWVYIDTATYPAGCCIGDEVLWNKIVPPAHAAATAAVAKRYKPDQIPMLFGVYFTKFMAAVSDRTASSTQTWGVTRDLVVAELFTGRLPSDPIRAAAYTAAALLVEVIPPDNGASPGVTTTSRGPSVHATTATTLQGTTVTCPTATAGRDDIDNVRAPNTLGARQAAIVSSLGQSPTIARTVSNSYEQKTQDIDQQQLGSMNSTAGYAAATACPRSGEYPGGTSNETASSTATMPRPIVTVLARTPWPTQQYRCRDPVDTLGTGSSVPSCDMSDRVSSAAIPGGEKPIRSSGAVSAMSGASSNAPPPTKAAVATAAASGADLNACVPPEPPPSRKMSVDASAPLVAQAAAGAVVAKEVTTTAAAAAADVTSSPVVAGAEVGGAEATAAVVLPAAAVGAATGPANEQLFLGAFDQDIDAHVSLGQTFYRVEPSVSVAPGATAMTAPAAEAIDTSGATKESTLAAAAVCATPLSTTVEVEATEATSAAGFPPTPNLLEAWDTAAGLPASPTTNPAEDFYCSVVGNGGSSPCSKKRKATCSECEGESDPCDCGSRKKVRKQ